MSDTTEPTDLTAEPPERTRWKWILIALLLASGIFSWFYVNRYGSRSRPQLESGLLASKSSGVKHDIGSFGWNRFRGPNGTGLSTDPEVPLTWSDDENLLWKTPIPGDGASSPIVTQDTVFVTSYTREDESSSEIIDLARHVHCADRMTGDVRWTKSFEAALPEGKYEGAGLPEHGYATSTPVTDGERLFVFFGKSGVYCLDLEGNELWHSEVGDGLNRMGWGSCSSPIVCGDMVVVNAGESIRLVLERSQDRLR